MTQALVFVLGLVVVPALSVQTADQDFWDIAEGYTAKQPGGHMQLAWRMFSAPDQVCAEIAPDVRLEPGTTPVTAFVDAPFDLDTLGVVATDSQGAIVAVPVSVQVRDSPAQLDIEQYRTALGPLVPRRPGQLTFRVRSVCAEGATDVLIEVVVTRHDVA